MSTFNLLEMAKSYFSSELVSKASSALGESEGGILKILNAAVPSFIGAIADKAATTDGANDVAKMAAEQHNAGILSSLGNFFDGDNGNNLLGGAAGIMGTFLGGGKGNMLTSLISNFADTKSSSVTSLLSMAAPAILGMVGKHTADNNIPTSDLGTLLNEQKDLAIQGLPAGFSLAALTPSAAPVAIDDHKNKEEKIGGLGNILLPLLILTGLSLGAWYFFKDGCKGEVAPKAALESTTIKAKETGTVVSPEAAATLDSLTGLVKYDLGTMVDVELPSGTTINVATNGFENKLINFIKTGIIDTVNKSANWFNMHDVQFVSGKTGYATPKALVQIKNVAAILKAYPAVSIKIGGNTDISGDAAANIALSQLRANQVMKDIIAVGAGANQIKEAKGYGSGFALAKAGDKIGMVQDRKTTAKVASK